MDTQITPAAFAAAFREFGVDEIADLVAQAGEFHTIDEAASFETGVSLSEAIWERRFTPEKPIFAACDDIAVLAFTIEEGVKFALAARIRPGCLAPYASHTVPFADIDSDCRAIYSPHHRLLIDEGFCGEAHNIVAAVAKI